jgi:lipid-A-disaccharide synthase
MKLYLIAGEDSGDLHGSNLLKALRAQQPDLAIRGVGGDKLQSEGMELVAHVQDINFMGFWEVLRNLRTIRRLFDTVKKDIQSWQPDAVVLIDYPGFNIRMLPFLRDLGLQIFYYISPQVWAWKKGRVKTLRQYVDRMMVILPFEKAFYAREGMEVDFVGHPLLDAISHETPVQKSGKKIALLPGSRKQEIRRMLPVMLETVDRFADCEFTIAGAPSQPESFYRTILGERTERIALRMNQTYAVLQEADYALVTSGTATLETALFKVPQVVCYKGNPFSFAIGKRLVKVRFISLVNLILDRPLVKELIQRDFNVVSLERELGKLMQEKERERIRQGYEELAEKLGEGGASERAAELILRRGLLQ